MGGGNAQKSAKARERNLEKAKNAAKGSQTKANIAAQSLKCEVCLATFLCTSSAIKLKEHSDSKHPKHQFSQCFPKATPPVGAS